MRSRLRSWALSLFSWRNFCTRFAHATKKATAFKRVTCVYSWSAGQDLNLRPTNATFPPAQTLSNCCTRSHIVLAAQNEKRENDRASRLNRLHIFCTRCAIAKRLSRLALLVTNHRECISWRVRCLTILHMTSSRTVTYGVPSSTSCYA